ncbi:MAG: hypothetical protein H0W25_15810 [Acidimicrobiia bacterium]|nr:hypothetical protein [Acidimicrobiia bacterium]
MLAPVAKPALPDATAAPADTAEKPAAGGTGAAQPDAMKPTVAKKAGKVIQKTKPTRRLQPGDLICGDCGEGNPQARKFCSRCGNTLENAESVKRKWWAKLIPKRKAKTLDVGARPGVGGVKARKKRSFGAIMGPLRKGLGLFAILFGLLFTFVAPVREWTQDNVIAPVTCRWNDFRNQEFDPLAAASGQVIGASTIDGIDPLVLFDRLTGPASTWKGVPVDGEEIRLIATFARPVDLDLMIFRNGDPESFTNFSRPAEVRLVMTDEAGARSEFGPIALTDSNDVQNHELENGGGAVQVEVIVTQRANAPTNNTLAIEDIEFQTQAGGDCSREARELEERCPSGLVPGVSIPPECPGAPDPGAATTVPAG